MACRLAGLSRSAYRRPLKGNSVADPDRALRDWLRAYAKKHPRWGYRRAYHDARADGWVVNHKKLQRLWRDEGLRVPPAPPPQTRRILDHRRTICGRA